MFSRNHSTSSYATLPCAILAYKMPTRISVLVTIMFALALTACESASPQPFYPTLAPTPALDPAIGFVTGENHVPAGKYPFVELWITTVGYSRSGECKDALMIDFPTYSFSDGRLSLYTGLADLDVNRDMIGFFGLGISNDGAMGGGASSELQVIQQLPFVAGNESIQSILEDGTLALQIADGQSYWLHPGQARIEYNEYDPDPDCHVILVSRLTNFGLLQGENIDLAGTPLAPAKTPAP